MTISRIATALAVIVCAFAAGCGGDDESDGGGGSGGGEATDITKADFVKQANQVCTEGNKALAEAAQKLSPNGEQPSDDDLKAFATNTLIPNVKGQLEDIRAIGFPEADADMLNDIFDDADGVLDDLADDPEAAVSNGEDPFADINPRLTDYGLTSCAT